MGPQRGEAQFIPLVVVATLYMTLLAGDTSVAGIPLRSVGTLLCVLGALMMSYAPRRGPTWPAAGLFTAWVALVSLSALWAPYGARVEQYLLDLLHLAILMGCASLIVPRLPDKTLRWVWTLTWLTGMAFALSALTGIGGQIDLQGRRSAFGMGPNIFARVVGLGAVAAVALAWQGRRWLIATIPVLVSAVILSGSRGGALALAVASLALVVLGLAGRSAKARRRTIATVAGLAAAGYYLVWPRLETWFNQRFIESIASGDSAGRDVILAQARDLWANHPLLGTGLDGYWGEVGFKYGLQHPHNLVLQSFAEAGLAAGVVLLLLLVVAFRRAWSVQAGHHSVFACAALLVLVSAMFSGTWYDSRFIWFYLIVGAEAIARSQELGAGAVGDEAEAGECGEQRCGRSGATDHSS